MRNACNYYLVVVFTFKILIFISSKYSLYICIYVWHIILFRYSINKYKFQNITFVLCGTYNIEDAIYKETNATMKWMTNKKKGWWWRGNKVYLFINLYKNNFEEQEEEKVISPQK